MEEIYNVNKERADNESAKLWNQCYWKYSSLWRSDLFLSGTDKNPVKPSNVKEYLLKKQDKVLI